MLNLWKSAYVGINNQAKQLIWLLEHDHVITAGISAKKDSDLKLTNSNINIIQTNRGGKYTYHGPEAPNYLYYDGY